MVNGGADRLTAVLEYEDVGDIIARAESCRPLGPQLDDSRCAFRAQLGECGGMQGAVQDDLVPAVGQRWPAIRDGPHVVRARSLEPARAKRALTRRLIGP